MKIVSKKEIYIYIYGSLYCRENSCTIGDLMNLMYISNQLIYLDMIFGKMENGLIIAYLRFFWWRWIKHF
jgi:hypothetical protein